MSPPRDRLYQQSPMTPRMNSEYVKAQVSGAIDRAMSRGQSMAEVAYAIEHAVLAVLSPILAAVDIAAHSDLEYVEKRSGLPAEFLARYRLDPAFYYLVNTVLNLRERLERFEANETMRTVPNVSVQVPPGLVLPHPIRMPETITVDEATGDWVICWDDGSELRIPRAIHSPDESDG